ncbi:hypothetical protein FACS189430_02170 [Bacteroidia bacterium]|nr:hypothetical protein FACS189430_02170 [Bacteroidia bacterium]
MTKQELENINEVYLYVGGYFSGYSSCKIEKTQSGAIAHFESSLWNMPDFPLGKEKDLQLTTTEWSLFVHKLLTRVINWEKEYFDPDRYDGIQWKLKISGLSKKPLKFFGSNLYPSDWNKFVKIFNKLEKGYFYAVHERFIKL